ncbi:MAG: ORF6N domain-containing protein [Betaproteobacteria bacterium]|nr:ORF6N domain-containing protein [Betaproteobacteria bacterium]
MRAPRPKPENLAPLVVLVRSERVLLDSDLAALYGVEARVLNQAVARNRSRFPEDFMFRLSAAEYGAMRSRLVTASTGNHPNSSRIVMSSPGKTGLRSQIVTSKGRGGRRYLPYAFTEQGVAMLSSVLRSARAVEVNIAIMRTFVQLRRLMDSNRELARRIEAMEDKYDEQFAVVFDAIKKLIADDDARKARPKRPIGFIT